MLLSITPQQRFVLLLILAAAILSPLDFYIVNLALTPIQQGIGSSPAQLQMIVSFYTCAYAVFQITGGRIGDLLGRKKMFLLGLMGFTLSSTLCGFAPNSTILIIGRIIQGISGAIMSPQILAIIHVSFSEEQKTKVMALYSFTFGLAAALGQYLGGYLIEKNLFGLGWRMVFLINLPIGILVWIGTYFTLPQFTKNAENKIDYAGIILLSLALGLTVYPLTLVSEQGWSAKVISLLSLSIVLIYSFVRFENYTEAKGQTPLVTMKIFSFKNLCIGSGIAFLFYCSGIFYLGLGIYLQETQHWTALQAGSAIIPFGMGFLLCSLLTPLIARRIGDLTLISGIILEAIGFGLLIISIEQFTSYQSIFYIGLFFCGCGIGFFIASIIRISLRGIPYQSAGLASGVINSGLQIGSAIGVAALGSVFFSLGKNYDYGHAFQVVLMILMGLLCIAGILSLFIMQTKSPKI